MSKIKKKKRSHHTPSHLHSTCQNDGKGSVQGIGKQQETHVSLEVHQGLNPFFLSWKCCEKGEGSSVN